MKTKEDTSIKYSIGDRFTCENAKYLLTATGIDHVLLVCLGDGCYWGAGSVVSNKRKITEAEFDDICLAQPRCFTRYWDSQKKLQHQTTPRMANGGSQL